MIPTEYFVRMDLLDAYNSDSSQDDESGRVFLQQESNNVVWERSKPHIPGNWATHVHVPITPSDPSILLQLQRQLEEDYCISGSLIVLKEPHVSLSRHIVVHNNSVEPLVTKLTEAMKLLPSRPITVLRDQIIVLYNDCDKSDKEDLKGTRRAFFAHPVVPTLHDLVQAIDDVLQQYQLPIYYQNPIFHVSIASMMDLSREIPHRFHLRGVSPASTTSLLHHVFMRSGHKVHHVPLHS